MTDAPPLFLALDLGSRRMGAVSAHWSLPLIIDCAAPIPVDPDDLGAAVASVDHIMSANLIAAVVVEHAKLYLPEGKSPAAVLAIAQNHEVCSRLHERLLALCQERGVPMHTIPRASWSHRVCPGTRGSVDDARANEGLRAHVVPESWAALEDQDQRDAAGALVGWLLGPTKKKTKPRTVRLEDGSEAPAPRRDRRKKKEPKPPREPTPEEIARAEFRARCTCGPDGGPKTAKGRHRAECPCAPPPTTRGSKEAAAAYVPMTRPAHPIVALARQAERRPDDDARHAEWAARLAGDGIDLGPT